MRVDFTTNRDRTATTDYWDCHEGAMAGRSWLQVYYDTWHLLCPIAPETVANGSRCRATAVPTKAADDEGGWRWPIMVSQNWLKVHVDLDAILGTPPALPNFGTVSRRYLRVYHNQPIIAHGLYEFGGKGHPELSAAISCRLEVVRPVNVNGNWCINGRVWRKGP